MQLTTERWLGPASMSMVVAALAWMTPPLNRRPCGCTGHGVGGHAFEAAFAYDSFRRRRSLPAGICSRH